MVSWKLRIDALHPASDRRPPFAHEEAEAAPRGGPASLARGICLNTGERGPESRDYARL